MLRFSELCLYCTVNIASQESLLYALLDLSSLNCSDLIFIRSILLLILPVLLLGHGLSLSLDLLLRGVLDDEGGHLVQVVHGEDVTAGLAGRSDHVLLNLHTEYQGLETISRIETDNDRAQLIPIIDIRKNRWIFV